jgi:hypothetical protein
MLALLWNDVKSTNFIQGTGSSKVVAEAFESFPSLTCFTRLGQDFVCRATSCYEESKLTDFL